MQRPVELIKSVETLMMLLFRKTSETTRAECCALALLARDGNLKAEQNKHWPRACRENAQVLTRCLNGEAQAAHCGRVIARDK